MKVQSPLPSRALIKPRGKESSSLLQHPASCGFGWRRSKGYLRACLHAAKVHRADTPELKHPNVPLWLRDLPRSVFWRNAAGARDIPSVPAPLSKGLLHRRWSRAAATKERCCCDIPALGLAGGQSPRQLAGPGWRGAAHGVAVAGAPAHSECKHQNEKTASYLAPTGITGYTGCRATERRDLEVEEGYGSERKGRKRTASCSAARQAA